MKIVRSFAELIGNTPLFDATDYLGEALPARVLIKLEYLNPAGSVKDRAAREMIDDAEQKGLISAGATIIEPTSGNTGIGLAAVAAERGYRTIMVMPDTMSVERRKILSAYGAEVVLTPGDKGMQGSIAKAEELHREIPNSFIPSQFSNPANAAAHYKTTGPEILRDTDGAVDIFVAGVGTGGTITGTGEYLKQHCAGIRIVGVEPEDSAFLSRGEVGAHGLQGIGAGFLPEVLNRDVLDEIITVTTGHAYGAARALAKSKGLLVGITSGAALYAASVLAKYPENAGKTIVALLPDTGDRYLSTALFD